MIKGTKLPRVEMVNVDTGEVINRGQGGIPYYKALKEGFIPTEDTPPEDTAEEYPQFLPEDSIREKIDSLFDIIQTDLSGIPNPKVVFKKRTPVYIDLSEEKQMLYSMLDELVGNTEQGFVLDTYLTNIEPQVTECVTGIIVASTAEDVYFQITTLTRLLNYGNPLSFEQASTLGNMGDFKGYNYQGWYEQSSRLDERFDMPVY